MAETNNASANFSFDFVTSAVNVTLNTSPAGLAYSVDGANYTTPQNFSWVPGANHTLAATGTQSGGAGTQYVWSSWSDGGALSHSIAPNASGAYTANFTTQYYLTMNAGGGGSGGVRPAVGDQFRRECEHQRHGEQRLYFHQLDGQRWRVLFRKQ